MYELCVNMSRMTRPPRDTRSPVSSWHLVLVLSLGLLACSEALNWRVLPLGDSGWEALLPCKPEVAERTVALPTQSATMHLRSCDVGSVTYAVAWMRLAQASDAKANLALWRQASQSSAQVKDAQPAQAWLVRGADWAQLWRGEGRRHDGQRVQVAMGHAAAGGLLVQLATYGAQASNGETGRFWDGLAPRRQ